MDMNVVTIYAPDGAACEARRDSPYSLWWDIGFPSGDVRFHGTKSQVEALIRRRIEADYKTLEEWP